LHKNFKLFLYSERKSACSGAKKRGKEHPFSGVMRLEEREKKTKTPPDRKILPGGVGKEII
jgi:hypothetical protein